MKLFTIITLIISNYVWSYAPDGNFYFAPNSNWEIKNDLPQRVPSAAEVKTAVPNDANKIKKAQIDKTANKKTVHEGVKNEE